MLKNQKGITLVALVVTIVVLIILATISITVAVQGGIIDKAGTAKDMTANEDAKWTETEANISSYIDSKIDGQ